MLFRKDILELITQVKELAAAPQSLTPYLVSLADLNELVFCSRIFVFVRMPETDRQPVRQDFILYNYLTSLHTQFTTSEANGSHFVRTIS